MNDVRKGLSSRHVKEAPGAGRSRRWGEMCLSFFEQLGFSADHPKKKCPGRAKRLILCTASEDS